MKNKLLATLLTLLTLSVLPGCGEDLELTQFQKSMNDFCSKVSEIDEDINNIDATKTTAPAELLGYLNDLDIVFQSLGRLDFPEEFDYLEGLADEAASYMTTAVESYEDAYSNGSYNSGTAEYARQNYERANKRIQIILAFLRGEKPDDADISIEYDN